MPLGLTAALALAAQSATGAQAPAAAPEAGAAAPSGQQAGPAPTDGCRRSWPNLETGEIVVCAERPQGYRIDPDILTAKKMKRAGGRPSRPSGTGVRQTSACAVGPHPMGCQSGGINIIGAALTAAEMASRLAKGEEIGSMFVTNPEPSEYELYRAAKAAREAREALEAAKAKAEAAQKPVAGAGNTPPG